MTVAETSPSLSLRQPADALRHTGRRSLHAGSDFSHKSQAPLRPLLASGRSTVDGNIENRLVVVHGSLFVFGDVHGSEIVVSDAVNIQGNAVDSSIHIGLKQYMMRKLKHHLGELTDGLQDLELTSQAIPHRELPRLIAGLVAEQFKDVDQSLAWLSEAFRWPGLRWDLAYERLIDTVAAHWSAVGESPHEWLGALTALRERLVKVEPQRVVEEHGSGLDSVASRIQDLWNSSLDSTGPVSIGNAHSSSIRAQSLVAHGAVIGGFTMVEHNARAVQLGRDLAPETSIATKIGHIEADLVFPGVILAAGSYRCRIRRHQVGLAFGPRFDPPQIGNRVDHKRKPLAVQDSEIMR